MYAALMFESARVGSTWGPMRLYVHLKELKGC
jgi:hypothetical protein